VPSLELLSRPGVRFLFPHAPVRPISVNGGASMRAWYDISSIDFESREQDSEGIRESANGVHQLVEREIERGVAPGNIILAGFSQGGAIALFAGLTSLPCATASSPVRRLKPAVLNPSGTPTQSLTVSVPKRLPISPSGSNDSLVCSHSALGEDLTEGARLHLATGALRTVACSIPLALYRLQSLACMNDCCLHRCGRGTTAM